MKISREPIPFIFKLYHVAFHFYFPNPVQCFSSRLLLENFLACTWSSQPRVQWAPARSVQRPHFLPNALLCGGWVCLREAVFLGEGDQWLLRQWWARQLESTLKSDCYSESWAIRSCFGVGLFFFFFLKQWSEIPRMFPFGWSLVQFSLLGIFNSCFSLSFAVLKNTPTPKAQ